MLRVESKKPTNPDFSRRFLLDVTKDGAVFIRERGGEIYQTALDPEVFGDRLDEAQREKDETVGILKAALDRAVKAEEEAAELVRLREEAEARDREERERREAEEAKRQRAEADQGQGHAVGRL